MKTKNHWMKVLAVEADEAVAVDSLYLNFSDLFVGFLLY